MQPLQLRCAWFVAHALRAGEILENFLRRSERLLENIVNAGEALDRLVQHQQGDDEAGELAGRHGVRADLLPRVGQQHDDGDGAEELDQRRGDGLLGDIAQIARLEPPRCNAKTIGFDLFGPERFDHLMSADGLLENLVQLGGVVLRRARGAPDAPAQAQRRHQHEGQQRQAEDRQTPVFLHDDPEQKYDRERLPQPIRQNVRHGDLNFLDVVHDRRHQPPGGGGFEKLGVLPQHSLEDVLAQIRNGREPDEVDQVIPEVVANPLTKNAPRMPTATITQTLWMEDGTSWFR